MIDIELRERVGVAVNPRAQTADSVGDVALMVAALSRVDELGALLVRMKYGDDRRRAGLHRAVLMIAKRERASMRFKRGRYIEFKRELRAAPHESPKSSMADVIERFSAAVLDAWLDDTCGACSGRGVVGGIELVGGQEPTTCAACVGRGRIKVDAGSTLYCPWPHGIPRSDRLVRGQHYPAPVVDRPVFEVMQRSEWQRCGGCIGTGRVSTAGRAASRSICDVCKGSGRRWQIPAQRAHAMGVPLDQYHRHWHERFETALRSLAALDEWTERKLKRQI
ncbi:hypothetical protein [Burkholderia ubonensis]|uniref:hypothetical protein n=1 Tax=Burkholderia ubonensis TaxID=101571 RepID=UPI000A70F686|nr:hypothetical protein [Burkholderia ubonensis]